MKEIGGYIEFENLYRKEYHNGLVSLNSGRNALEYITKVRDIEKIYIPYFLCSSIKDTLSHLCICFDYYDINQKFIPELKFKLGDNEYLYIVNYYGQLNNGLIKSFKKRYKNVIVDNTQAFFQKPIKHIDTIYSCRKFFGISDGAYLSIDKYIDSKLDSHISANYITPLIGRMEKDATSYYADYKSVSSKFKNETLKSMSKFTKNILGALNYKEIRKKRHKNFTYLNNHLKDINKLNLNVNKGPFSYPLLIDNANELKVTLINKKVYIPKLWPGVEEVAPELSYSSIYSTNILPIPCDHRYNLNDMKFIVDIIRKEVISGK